ncbi:hypothetical protein JCGZ_13531 [Jatropha curcas]|uniref:Protein kinase domain-containing protein n=1 Tax=Jatropha curcas TaxID=180498 RepID=A0A067KMW5_JATCU|nr:hypothetical protein JCGZ_13531 [Jatropha curcas]
MGLEGNFPTGIENCTTLTGLNLSGNQISGTIPSDISKRIPFLSVLDLSHNNLSGEIPVSIANCSFLNVLILDNNRLTGQIPTEIGLLSRLRRFSVANNLLSGPVPNFNPNFTAWVGSDGYANNEGLCGVPLDPCLPPPIEFPVPFFHGFVVGYAVAFALVIVLFALYSTTKFSKNKVLGKKIKKPIKIPIDGRRIDIKISTLERMVTRMSCKEIAEVTSNFDKENIIGQGKMGTMYKATLPNGWFLAIKRLYNFQNFKKEFVIHLNITSKCILLDQKFEPKMSNFNGALFLNRNDTQSTRDFIVHREFWEMGFVKKDVHSFGMLLVELITGKDPTGIINSFSIFNGTELSISSSGLYDAIDKRIVGQGNDGEIFQILRIACDCVQAFPEKRPTMLKVYRTLRAIGQRYGLEDDSDMLSQTEISMFKLGLK